MKRYKPKPTHWIFTLYWWNPLVYILLFIAMFGSMYDGGLKQWVKEVKKAIKNYDWN